MNLDQWISMHNLTHLQAGQVVGATERTVRRWISGRFAPPEAVNRLLEVFRMYPDIEHDCIRQFMTARRKRRVKRVAPRERMQAPEVAPPPTALPPKPVPSAPKPVKLPRPAGGLLIATAYDPGNGYYNFEIEGPGLLFYKQDDPMITKLLDAALEPDETINGIGGLEGHYVSVVYDDERNVIGFEKPVANNG